MSYRHRSTQTTRAICLSFALALSALSLIAGPNPPTRPRILGIAAVHLYSTSGAGARDFYSKTLNAGGPCMWCEETPRPPFVARLNKDQLVSVDAAPNPTPLNLLAEVTLAVSNLEELGRYLKAQKIAVTPIKVPALMQSGMTVTDPEGRRITFISMVPPMVQPTIPSVAPSNAAHLIHAGFIVHDRAATEHFYKDILGFRPYWHGGMKDDGKDEWVSMQVPDGTDWLEFMVNVSPDADQRVRGIMNHIAIGVTDIHETEKRLREAGAPVNEPPKIGRDGKWQLNLYDPDQTRVEFMEFTPVEKPCCSEFTGPHPHP